MRRWFVQDCISPTDLVREIAFPVSVLVTMDSSKVLLEYEDDQDTWMCMSWAPSAGMTPSSVEPPSFGANILYQVDHAWVEASASPETPYERLSVSGDLPGGQYRVGWAYEWKANSTTAEVVVRVLVDGVVRHRCVRCASSTLPEATETDCAFCHVPLVAGNHVVSIDMACVEADRAVALGNVRIEVWRIG